MYSSNKRKVQKTLSGRSQMIAIPKTKPTKKIKGSVKQGSTNLGSTNFNATTLEDLLKKIGEFKPREAEKKVQGEGVVDIIEKGVKTGTSLANKANAINKIAKRFGIDSGAQPYIDKFGNALDVGHHLLDAGKSLKKVIGKGVEEDIEKQILSLGKGTPQEGTGIVDYIIKFLLLFLEPDDPEQEEFKEEPRREEPRREEPRREEPRREQPKPETPPEDKSKNCVLFLKSMGIKTKRDFNKWGLRGGHPDKGGETLLFQQVSNCVDKIIKGKGMTGGSTNNRVEDPMDIDEEPRQPIQPIQPIQPPIQVPRQPIQPIQQRQPVSADELLRRLNERTALVRRLHNRARQQGLFVPQRPQD
jgi:hypothetical protein